MIRDSLRRRVSALEQDRQERDEIAGVSHDTIARVEKIVQKAPEEVLVPKTRPHIMPYPADLLSPGLLTPPANGRA
jgi:hypothetical protein